MRKQIILIALIGLIGVHSNAQLQEKAEDISPLLIGGIIPDTLLIAVLNNLKNSK